MNTISSNRNKKESLGKKLWNAKYLYLLVLPGVLFYFIFNYIPMYGIKIAFLDFYPRLGVNNSPWVGWDNFKTVFADELFWRAFRNTIIISMSKIISGTIFAVLTAVFLNELRMRKFKKVTQIILTFPHFLSWVIIAGLVNNLFTNSGVINTLIASLGGEKIDFLSDPKFFFGLLITSDIWKEAGWGSIVYLAAIASINEELYESASLDGASRLQTIFHITLPSIRPTIVLMLILSVGGIMDGGFDQIFNLYNPLVYEIGDTLDTYIYRITFGTSYAVNPGIGAAIGVFKSVISCILVLTVDRIAKLFGERGII